MRDDTSDEARDLLLDHLATVHEMDLRDGGPHPLPLTLNNLRIVHRRFVKPNGECDYQ